MHPALIPLIFMAFSITAFAQDHDESTTTETLSRKAILRGLVAQDHGEVTAIEPSSRADGSVVIGYSSGAALVCHGSQGCTELGGTPSTPVELIAVSMSGTSELIWLTYRQGAIYQCTNSQCRKFTVIDALQE